MTYRTLLKPLSWAYGAVLSVRNALYTQRIVAVQNPIQRCIAVGNLAVGGTGKTPAVEYLLRYLLTLGPATTGQLATLSRGYGRQTRGFRLATPADTAATLGDEPLQLYQNFGPAVCVTVGENRAAALHRLAQERPQIRTVVLDDAYQHRAVQPHLNILLTDYAHPFYADDPFPGGRLRERRAGARRADIIIITKCPVDMTPRQRRDMLVEIDPYAHQKVFFSRYEYGQPYPLLQTEPGRPLDLQTDILLLSAIANTDYLLTYLAGQSKSVQTLEFTDHHYFKEEDLVDLKRRFEQMDSREKIIITTEKDATRLELHRDFFLQNNLPVYVLPVEVVFCDDDEAGFQKAVKDFMMGFKV